MITADLRTAIARAVATAGFEATPDPGLRPGGAPGRYAASVALHLGPDPRSAATALAKLLAREPWIATAEVTGPAYLTITVTPEALTALPARMAHAGPGCAESDALAGTTVPAPPPADPLTASTWEKARAALAAQLTVRLASAAGATVAPIYAERSRSSSQRDQEARDRSETKESAPTATPHPQDTEVAAAVAFAGRDAVTFALARAIPGKPLRIDPAEIARHLPGNPAYAVRYAHARAASGVRWAAATATGTLEAGAGRETTTLLDALSWLPERVAIAARRGRPDEFARYLEELAGVTIEALSSPGPPGNARAPGTDRLALATAARIGLAAGLSLLGVSAPDRL